MADSTSKILEFAEVSDLSLKFEGLLECLNASPKAYEETVNKIRKLILLEGIPEGTSVEEQKKLPTLRGRVWRVLLGVGTIDVERYLQLVALGPCDCSNNIREDAVRTHVAHSRKSAQFRAKVTLSHILRVMNALIHHRKSKRDSKLDQETYYSQAWCIYASVFLMHLPEAAAFWCLVTLLEVHGRGFASSEGNTVPMLIGAFDQLLQTLDPALSKKMFSKRERSSVGLASFGAIHSLFGNRKPMEEVSKIWDIIIGFGPQMIVPMALAELVLKRDDVLSGSIDAKKLLAFNPDEDALAATPIISLAVALLPQIPQSLYDEMCQTVRT